MATSNSIQIFQYNGSPITFQMGDCVMVNATEMAKPFGKSANHWLRNKSTEKFIKELARLRNCNPVDLVQVTNGGNGEQGTLMHEDVAMEFARWLHPGFAIWCNDRIKELMKHGITATEATIESILNDPANTIKILQALQTEREEKAKLLLENKEQQHRIETLQYTTEEQDRQIQQNQHKVEYFDNTLQNTDAIPIEIIAKALGTCPATLNKRLEACGFQYRSKSKQWLLRSPYDALGLHHDDTWTSPHGTHKKHYTKFFESGKLFITMLHNNNYDIRTTYKQYIAQQQQLATL